VDKELPKPEVTLETILQAQFESGYINRVELMRIVEEVKAYRAQQMASVYARWAVGVAGLSAVISTVSIVISLTKH
jgi:hypothetical protein